MEKLLSIVIPVYNVEKYLEKCLDSIGNLSEEIEVILINDGSTDDSGKICEKYSKQQGYIYINKKNEGCSKTRNLGITIAKGKYIWFIDPDDFIEKNSLEIIKKKLSEREIDTLVFGFKLINSKEEVLDKFSLPERITKMEILSDGNLLYSVWNKIYNLTMIKDNKIFFPENTHMCEDVNFNFKAVFLSKNIEKLNLEIYYYCKHGNGVTNNILKRKETFIAFDDLIEYCKKNNIFIVFKNILKRHYKLHCIKYTYKIILESIEDEKIKKRELAIIKNEIIKRKKYFKSTFLILRYKILFNYYRKNKKKYFKECERR